MSTILPDSLFVIILAALISRRTDAAFIGMLEGWNFGKAIVRLTR
jgi:hypothetical protein